LYLNKAMQGHLAPILSLSTSWVASAVQRCSSDGKVPCFMARDRGDMSANNNNESAKDDECCPSH